MGLVFFSVLAEPWLFFALNTFSILVAGIQNRRRLKLQYFCISRAKHLCFHMRPFTETCGLHHFCFAKAHTQSSHTTGVLSLPEEVGSTATEDPTEAVMGLPSSPATQKIIQMKETEAVARPVYVDLWTSKNYESLRFFDFFFWWSKNRLLCFNSKERLNAKKLI